MNAWKCIQSDKFDGNERQVNHNDLIYSYEQVLIFST